MKFQGRSCLNGWMATIFDFLFFRILRLTYFNRHLPGGASLLHIADMQYFGRQGQAWIPRTLSTWIPAVAGSSSYSAKYFLALPIRYATIHRHLTFDSASLSRTCASSHVHFYPAPLGERSIAISLSVCLSDCPRAYLWNPWADLHEIFDADPLWPWLGPPLAGLRYVMYFRFYEWRHVGP